MIEPSDQDFGDTPDSVREYVNALEQQIEQLKRRAQNVVDSRGGDVDLNHAQAATVGVDEIIWLESLLEGNG